MTVATGNAEALLKPAEAPGDDVPTRAAKRVSDPELVALAELDEIFATLDPGEADRCLYWLTLRYGQNNKIIGKGELEDIIKRVAGK